MRELILQKISELLAWVGSEPLSSSRFEPVNELLFELTNKGKKESMTPKNFRKAYRKKRYEDYDLSTLTDAELLEVYTLVVRRYTLMM